LLVVRRIIPVKRPEILTVVRSISLKQIFDSREDTSIRRILQTFLEASNPSFADIIRICLTALKVIPVKLHPHSVKWFPTLFEILLNNFEPIDGTISFQICHLPFQRLFATHEMQLFELCFELFSVHLGTVPVYLLVLPSDRMK